MTLQSAANRLAAETSPYLRQHMHNPVDWYPWGEEAFAEARRRGCPILLSVGYSACHWCHVMERESFESPEIAALMNRHFVCVKVDREERPDVDQLYMTAVQIISGQGGWPMTVFLTPEGHPFYGGTYYPPEDRYGRPGFPRVLQAVARAWQEQRGSIESQGAALLEALRQEAVGAASRGPITPRLMDAAFSALSSRFDERMGGLSGAPKFPQPMILDFLIRYGIRTGRQEAIDLAGLTLHRMAEGGIRDHLAGGFHRYSTDDHWLVPHFEKMLYDNAQLASTYLRAWRATGDSRFCRVAQQTLDFVRREMTASYGGFYSSMDADTEGEEGRTYVWTEQEIRETLGASDAEIFCRVYGVTQRGNFEGRNVLSEAEPSAVVARALGIADEEMQARLADMRARLLAVRDRRPQPALDDKTIAAWNGLALAAFSEAAAVLGRADYLQTAMNNAEFVLSEMLVRNADGPTLMRTGRETTAPSRVDPGRLRPQFRVAPIPGYLDDYAAYALGLLALYEATFDERWLNAAVELVDVMLGKFSDREGLFALSEDAGRLPLRPQDPMDNATPSGQSCAVEALLRLAILTDRDDYRLRAEQVLQQMATPMTQAPSAFGRLLCAADLHIGPTTELVIVGDPDDPRTRALLSAAYLPYRPNLIVAGRRPGDEAGIPLLRGRSTIDGEPAAYVCRDRVCLAPTSDPSTLARLLDGA